jgi:hypothetical protein
MDSRLKIDHAKVAAIYTSSFVLAREPGLAASTELTCDRIVR